MITASTGLAAARGPAGANANPIRVAFVVHVMQVAGAEMLVTETVRRLRGDIEATVLCLDAVGELGEALRREGVEVVCLGRRPGLDLSVASRLARHALERRIEVFHAHQYTPFFYSALARLGRRQSPRLILTEHGRHYPDRVSARRRWTNRVLLGRFADAINACCEFSARALWERDGFARSRVAVIRNGIDLERYGSPPDRETAKRRLGLREDRRYVACVARFHPVKDHATLLRAFAMVRRERGDAELLLVGDGPERRPLEAQARDLCIAEAVHFLGIRADVPQILQASDLFALTSLSEAASLTLLEAMASELPVVVTAVGGNPEIVRDGVEGLLMPRGDARAGAGAILRLLSDDVLASEMGRAGRQRVTEDYLVEETVAAYGELYRRLCRPD